MRCLASSATAIFTPASAYFMVSRLHDLLRAAERAVRLAGSTCGAMGAASQKSTTEVTLWENAISKSGPPPDPIGIREGGAYILKHMKQPAPADRPRMNQGISVGEEPGHDVAVPGIAGRVQRHIDEHRGAEDVFARHTSPIT